MNWINSLLSDGHNGTISSKRVVTLLAFLICAFALVADIFGHKVTPSLFDSMIYLVIAGLGFTASEKFAKRKEEEEK